MHPLLTCFEQLAAGPREGRTLLQVADEFEVILALEVAVAGHAVGSHQGIRFLAQNPADLVWYPDKEPALFTLAAGILGGIEPAGRVGHFTHDVVQDLLRGGTEELVAGDRLTSEGSQDPGVEVGVCLWAPGSWELS
jgi:hypothetical protein